MSNWKQHNKEKQLKLRTEGLYRGPIDGIWTSKCSDAWDAYNKRQEEDYQQPIEDYSDVDIDKVRITVTELDGTIKHIDMPKEEFDNLDEKDLYNI